MHMVPKIVERGIVQYRRERGRGRGGEMKIFVSF